MPKRKRELRMTPELQKALDELVRKGAAVRREDGSYAAATGIVVVEDHEEE